MVDGDGDGDGVGDGDCAGDHGPLGDSGCCHRIHSVGSWFLIMMIVIDHDDQEPGLESDHC